MSWKANGKADLPLADRERAWDGSAAEKRVRTWAGGPAKEDIDWAKYRQAFFVYDDAAADGFGGYKLGFADVASATADGDGALVAVPKGIFACAGGHGVTAADLPDDVKAAVKRKITAYYQRMAREFEDDGIRSPFERKGGAVMTGRGNGFPAIERKALAGEQVVEERVVTGFPAIMGNVDDGGDVLLPGAFTKTLAERGERLRYLWMHDSSQAPIARIVSIAEVGSAALPAALLAKYPEATGALKVSREYLETPRGEEALIGIRKGAIKEMSFAYDALSVGAPEEALRWGKGCRRLLKEVRLWECSDVNWGMNPATMNLKSAVAALIADLPQEPGPARQKALAEWFEAQLHLRFTEIADNMFGDGYLLRDERIALSGLIGDALDAFHAGMAASEELVGVRSRERWEQPPEPAGGGTSPLGNDGEMAQKAAAALLAERRRRVAAALQRLALVGA